MGTTADKLALLVANKQAIRDAITEKTGEDAGEVMSTYAEKIMNIQTGPEYWRTTILLDQTITDPATMITKVYDDGGIGLIRANSHRYVCKLVDGVMQAKQLQDGNGTLYVDGTTADLTGAEGDVMMKLPEFWYKAQEQETDKWLISFAYGAAPDSGYKHWDGKDFIGVYEAYVADSNVYSRSGVASTGAISQANFKTYARNRGEGYTLVKWKHHCIMAFLFYAEYVHTNSQKYIGAGTDSSTKATGATDLLGMEDTSADVNGNTQSINYYGLENWWGNKYEWIDNVIVNYESSETDGIWNITEDDGTQRSITGTTVGDYIAKLVIGENLDAIPLAYGGSATTGFCDAYGYASSPSRIIMRSRHNSDELGGVAYVAASQDATTTLGITTSRLAYRGEYEEYDGVFAAEYSEVGAFNSNGSQYFDTGFMHNQNTRVVMHVKATDTPTANAFFFDGPSGSSTRKGVFYLLSAKALAVDYKTGDTRQTFSDVLVTDELLIDYNKNSCNINDEIKVFTEDTFQSASNLVLLASNLNNTPTAPIAAFLYSCRIYDKDTLIRDYVPCVRKADGVSGLWDKVNKTFNTPITIA